MKQMRKRGLAVVMVFALLIGNICITPKEAKAASHTQNEAVNWAMAQIGKGLDYDGMFGNQCVDLIKYYYAYFGVAGYAMGNANAYMTNSLPSGWTRVYGNYQPGDIAVWKTNHSCSTCGTGSLGHVGIITSADSVGFNAVNQNFNNQSYCTKNWFYCSALACAIRPSFGTASANISFANFNQNGVWDNNAEMYIKIMNPGKLTVSKVGCYLYNASGNLVKFYSETCNLSTSYVNYNCNINNDMKYTLTPGTSYKFVLYAIVNGQEFRDTTRSFTTTGSSDQQKPSITDVSVYNVSETGYDVRCKATDNVGVVRVQFPTWTDLNGQDDILNGWEGNAKASGTLGSDGYYTYHVSIADHNNELGIYYTHIYAYDKAGNYVCVVAPTTKLQKTVVATPTPGSDSDVQKTDGNALATVAEREYNTYCGQKYNYQYGTSPWCCNFVSWCARQAGISTDVMKSTATVQTMYDNLINACGAKVVSSPQRGDLVFYKYTDYDSARFHHIGIMVNSTESVQGNVNNTWWKGKPNALNNIKEMVYVRPAYDGKYVAPSTAHFSDYNLNKVTDDNAELYIKVQNPNREGVTSVGCELYDEQGILLKTYSESCNWTTSYVNYNCNFANDMHYTLSPGTTYKALLYAVVGGKRINDTMRTFTTTGTKKDAAGKNEVEDNPATVDSTPTPTPAEPTPAVTPTPIPSSPSTATPTAAPIRPTTSASSSSPVESKLPTTATKPVTAGKPSKVVGLKLYTYSKKIAVTWSSSVSNNRTGYQIQYAMNKSFTKKMKKKNVGRYATDAMLKKLKKNKYYYVRVRGINRVDSVTKYGAWSKVKKIKVR